MSLCKPILKATSRRGPKPTSKPVSAIAPVIHNFQHDLESLWWIIFFIAVFYTGHKPSIVLCQDIFQPRIIVDLTAIRHTIFAWGFGATPGFFESVRTDLEETLFWLLDRGRHNFVSEASNRPVSAIQEPASFSFVCGILPGFFEDAALVKDVWGHIPLVRPEVALASDCKAEDLHPELAVAPAQQLQSTTHAGQDKDDSRGVKRALPENDEDSHFQSPPPLPTPGRKRSSVPARISVANCEETRTAKKPRREACSF